MAEGDAWRRFVSVTRHPVMAIVVLKCLEFAAAWLERRRRAWMERKPQLSWQEEKDVELLQGCLLSTEHVLSLGRVEKRTLWRRPLQEVLGGNLHLRAELLHAAQICHAQGDSCLVTRWLPCDERYHVLQASLDAMSSLFGANFVHCDSLACDVSAKSVATWYCLTVVAARDCHFSSARDTQDAEGIGPHSMLRVLLVNESELRRIADGKLNPPSSGFFNTRHAGRYRMLQDFARNFQTQLVKPSLWIDGGTPFSPGNGQSAATLPRRAHQRSPMPDGGPMKRIDSVPKSLSFNMGDLSKASSAGLSGADLQRLAPKISSKSQLQTGGLLVKRNAISVDTGDQGTNLGDGGEEDCCFLRLHVPHFSQPVNGHASAPTRRPRRIAANFKSKFVSDPGVEP